ncbi:hypothetical protein FKP32DRAFT_1629462 [Trametes sanguinea]|nr:hypothetical protein FKP32DRAFT_1629462 [Trametes sanguinea]
MLQKLLCLPYDDWMNAFLQPQPGDAPIDDEAFHGLFDSVPLTKGEPEMYDPFVKAVNEAGILEGFVLAKTYSKADPTDKDGLKADGGMYAAGSPAVTEERTDWASVEVFIECKTGNSCDPYDESVATGFPSADSRRDALGQITTYASHVFKYQHRTHHFSLILFGTFARLGRWDRSGIVFSSKFDYKKEPAKLARFLTRVARATAEARGHDSTATRVVEGSADHELLMAWKAKTLDEDDYAGKRFVKTLKDNWPWWRLRVQDSKHGERDFLVGEPTFTQPGVVGRGTRGYIALSVSDPGTPLVYLKDCWRVVHDRSELEGDILSYLNEKGVTNVPTALYHGDILGQRTISQSFWRCKKTATRVETVQENTEHNPAASSAEATQSGAKSEDKIKCPMKTHQHYRLVVNEVGMPLEEFPRGEVLCTAIADAINAHEDAYNKAQVIHRDISVGNILIVPYRIDDETYYQGLLADWELSKRLEDMKKEPRHPDRTGTWQFMSVNALRQPKSHVEIADELESFLHVMIYCAIRYLPHTCTDVGEFLYHYFDDGVRDLGGDYTCGPHKQHVITTGQLLSHNHHPIVFLRKPELRALYIPAPSDGGTSTVGNTAPSATPSSSNQPKPIAAPDVPEEHRHPIDNIIAKLLPWFSARYQLMQPNPKRGSKPRKVPPMGTPAWIRYMRNVEGNELLGNSDTLPEDTRTQLLAREHRLRTHRAMAGELSEATDGQTQEWPGSEDKLPDQLDPMYNPNKPEKNKRAAPEGELQAQPASKRLRSLTSQSSKVEAV